MSDFSKSNNRLVKGTVVYMIGNILSKALQMLILPVITASLNTSQYGYYDLIVTTISLITPVVTLQIVEAMFRYLFEATTTEKKSTISTVSIFLLFGCIILAFGVLIVDMVFPKLEYPILVYFNYLSFIVFNYMQKMARCTSHNKEFAVSGVLNTIVMLAMQAICLLGLKLSVDGMLIANCVSYFAASLYLEVKIKSFKYFSIKHFDKSLLNELIKYSLPLVPNSICWWLVSASDRYVISIFLGTGANGIYSIASKFSMLLTFVTSVFQMAWQESAIIESSQKDRDIFYSNTFNSYMKLLMSGFLVALPTIRILFPLLTDSRYHSGYLYNPILLMGAIFSAFSQFYGSAYLAFKKTNGAFSTTVAAAIINLVVGVSLIKWVGLFGPALGTVISFCAQWLLRTRQMKDYFKVSIDKVKFVLLLVLEIVFIFFYYLNFRWLHFSCIVIGSGVFIACNRQLLNLFCNKAKRIIHR